jgi:hypothetical protein
MSLAAVPTAAPRRVSGPLSELDMRYDADVWHAAELGVSAVRGRTRASLTTT